MNRNTYIKPSLKIITVELKHFCAGSGGGVTTDSEGKPTEVSIKRDEYYDEDKYEIY